MAPTKCTISSNEPPRMSARRGCQETVKVHFAPASQRVVRCTNSRRASALNVACDADFIFRDRLRLDKSLTFESYVKQEPRPFGVSEEPGAPPQGAAPELLL